jgi:hypothetical protein
MRKALIGALGLLCWSALATSQVKPREDDPKIVVGFPDENWTLVFDAPGLKVSINGVQPDGRVYLAGDNKSTGVTLSLYLEKASNKATAAGCAQNQKQRLEQKVSYKRENIETRESSGMAIAEYTIAEFNGIPLQQRNLFACLAKDDVYVDLHLSKVLFKPPQEELFNAVLNSVHFVDKTPN